MNTTGLTFKELIALVGGWTVITVASFTWAIKLVNERILSKWRRDEQSGLEVQRHSLSREQLMLESAIRSSQQGQDVSHEKRLSAIEHLWSAIIKLRSDVDGIRFFFGILLPKEYDLVFTPGHEGMATSINKVNDTFVTAIMKSVDDIELERPYLGEVLWLRFFIYRAFIGRLGYIISRGKERRHIEDWRQDKGVQQILSSVLPKNTLDGLFGKSQDVTAIYRVFGQLEFMIIEEISLILSGRRSAVESFENAKELHRFVAEFAFTNAKAAGS